MTCIFSPISASGMAIFYLKIPMISPIKPLITSPIYSPKYLRICQIVGLGKKQYLKGTLSMGQDALMFFIV